MAHFLVEIRRGDDWNKLTTYQVGEARDGDKAAAVAKARLNANMGRAAWQRYFADQQLRVREVA